MFYAKVGDTGIVYTGDYNMTPDRHLGAAQIDRLQLDLLITEYGTCLCKWLWNMFILPTFQIHFIAIRGHYLIVKFCKWLMIDFGLLGVVILVTCPFFFYQ